MGGRNSKKEEEERRQLDLLINKNAKKDKHPKKTKKIKDIKFMCKKFQRKKKYTWIKLNLLGKTCYFGEQEIEID